MNSMSLSDLSDKMKAIDFAMLSTHAANGAIAARPMSNNGDVDYDGDSYFFCLDSTHTVGEIERNADVSLTFSGAKGLLGKPPLFIAVEGKARLIRDKSAFAEHWTKSLDHWFKEGVDTPGLVLIQVHAARIHYWDGEEGGEIKL